MFNNRFTLIAAVLFALFVSLAVASPFSSAPKSVDLSWPPRSIIIPVSSAWKFSDFHQRHHELRVSGEKIDLSDYLARHPGLEGGFAIFNHTAEDRAPLDECYDVSLSELTACREASQSPSP